MKHYAWEENKQFSLAACTGICYRVTVYYFSKLWCTHIYSAALKMEAGGLESSFRFQKHTHKGTCTHTSPPSKTVTEVILYSCCCTWRRTSASHPAGHLIPYLGTIPVLPSTFSYQPESLSQPTTACPHCKAATYGSSSGPWWQKRQRHVVAGMGPRRAQSSLASDIWEHKDFSMKK